MNPFSNLSPCTPAKPDPLYDLIEAGYHCGWSREQLHAEIKAKGLDEVSDETLDNLEGDFDEILQIEDNVRKHNNSIFANAITGVPYPMLARGGDMMTFEDWAQSVRQYAFIDYDGYGIWSDGIFTIGELVEHPEVSDFLYYGGLEPTHHGQQLHNTGVRPSLLMAGALWKPEWATHVLWFNR